MYVSSALAFDLYGIVTEGLRPISRMDGVCETTEANCKAAIAIGVDGTSMTVSTTAPVSGTDFHVYQVAITGGAEKTASADACNGGSKPNAAAGTDPNTLRVMDVALAMGLLGVGAL